MPLLALREQVALAASLSLFGLLLLFGPLADSSEAASCAGASTPAYKLSGDEAGKVALCLLNRERAAHGIKPLKPDRKQEGAARDHNRLMIRERCFSHQCSGERDLVGRMEAAGCLPCECSWSVGENIAWGSGSTASPASIVDAWMHSAPHRANILNESFDEAGVAIQDGSPSGGGDGATFTVDFGYKR